MSAFYVFLVVLGISGLATAVKVNIEYGATQCVSEHISAEVLQNISPDAVEISSGLLVADNKGKANTKPRRNVDVTVTDPQGNVIWSQARLWSEQEFTVKGSGMGVYSLCMTNRSKSHAAVTVDVSYFALSHHRPRPGEVAKPTGTAEERGTGLAQHIHIMAVHESIVRLREQLSVVSGEQRYMQKRLDRHWKTNKSTHRRTTWTTLVESGALLAVAAVQIGAVHWLFNTSSHKFGHRQSI